MEGGGKKIPGEIEMTELKRMPNINPPITTPNPIPVIEQDISDEQISQEGNQQVISDVHEAVDEEIQPIQSNINDEQPILPNVVVEVPNNQQPILTDVGVEVTNNQQDISNANELLSLPAEEAREKNPDVDIIEPPKPPSIPILFNKLKKMYQNNMFIIKQLENSRIEPLEIDGLTINNLYELLKLNETLMHRKGSKLNMSAPKYKFVINNAANVGSNLNGSRMFIPPGFLEAVRIIVEDIKQNVYTDGNIDIGRLTEYMSYIDSQLDQMYVELKNRYQNEIKILNSKKRSKIITIREYNELLQKKYEQKTFERDTIVPLENKAFLLKMLKENPTFFKDFEDNYATWFKNSQPIFGIYRSLQRGIFCPTSSMMDAMDNCSLKYNTTEPKEVGTSYSEILYEGNGKYISFGGVVLNYDIKSPDGNDELVSRIYYDLNCNVGATREETDIMSISTLPIKVSESNDLKARVAYQGVVNKIKDIYDLTFSETTDFGIEYLNKMWEIVQYQFNPYNFNMLLSSTSLKTMGDYLQESQACFKWGGYVSDNSGFPNDLKRNPRYKEIKNKLIYRSVSKEESIFPYDKNTGNGLRLGIQGDRPSGFRSIYILLNGEGDVNDEAITGYMFTSSTQNPSRTLLVSRNSYNMRMPNSEGLKGNVIYVTRELQVPDKDGLLKSLEFLNVKDKNRKVEGEIVSPEITEPIISGSENIRGDELLQNPMTKIQPLRNVAYDELLDYQDKEFVPKMPQVEVENELTDKEQERLERQRRKEEENKRKEEEKRIEAQRVAEERRIKAEKDKKIKETITIIKNQIPGKSKSKTLTSAILDSLRPRIQELNIEELIFEEIYNEIKDQEQAASDKKAKSAATSAERIRKQQENEERRENYLKTQEGINLQSRIAGIEEEITNLIRSLDQVEGSRKEIKTKKDEINNEIKLKRDEIEKLNIDIDVNSGVVIGGKNTRVNKKNNLRKVTKKRNKNKFKLTKKYKKIKIHKTTRKSV
jgi:hypothetical protein